MRFNSVGDVIDNLPDIRRTPHHLMFSPFHPCKTFECIHSHHSREVADAETLGGGESCAIGCLLIVVAACGCLSILVVGPVDVSEPLLLSVDPGGGSLWPINGRGGHSLCFVGVVRREG